MKKNLPQEYQVRFVKTEDAVILVSLYHLARTALCGKGKIAAIPYERMLWAAGEFAKMRPAVTSTAAYKDLCGLLGRG
ncbi:MAG TPA: hypothetical protein VLI39_07525 [Sedimentisphaerales bacterium]|nr:hypothetical protein [Sedimentisphaerales bacterium]